MQSTQSEIRRHRLAQLLDLAQSYRGCTRKELAKTLGRDPTKLIPGSGVPKLDLVVDLSSVLEWSVDDVVGFLWNGADECDAPARNRTYEELDTAAREAHRAGDYRVMVDIAERAFAAATTPEQRARACNRAAGGWDGLGRQQQVLAAIQRGLRESPVCPEFRRILQSNLANAYYSLWSLVESKAIARELVSWFDEHPATSVRDRKTFAYAHYVLGNTHRRMIATQPEQAREHAERAAAALTISRDRYTQLAGELDDESLAGIAQTCDGGLIEANVTLGVVGAESALALITDRLDEVEDTEAVGDRLESYGWWCIFGCAIALRTLDSERELQQYMAVFTNKADEIAERLDNWSMRERVFTMEHSRWERAVGCTGFDIPRIVDEDEVRVITGTMARFPNFRDTGWQILRSAKVIRTN